MPEEKQKMVCIFALGVYGYLRFSKSFICAGAHESSAGRATLSLTLTLSLALALAPRLLQPRAKEERVIVAEHAHLCVHRCDVQRQNTR